MPSDWVIQGLIKNGFKTYDEHEGRLMLVELLVKAGAGFMNSYTEEAFMSEFRLLKKDRTLNTHGRRFLKCMLYSSSNNISEFAIRSNNYRKLDK